MDEDIRASLSDIRQDVKDGFTGVNGRIDSLVTKGEFDATVLKAVKDGVKTAMDKVEVTLSVDAERGAHCV